MDYRERRLQTDIRRLHNSDKICPENKQTILKFLDYYSATGVKAATKSIVIWALSVCAELLNKPFTQATKDDIIKVVSLVEGKYKSAKSKRTLKAEIKRLYKWLGKQELVDWIRLNTVKKKILREEIPTREEIERMAHAALNPRDKALTLLLYGSGCRISELLGLRIKDILFDNFGCILLVDGKTGKRRVRVIQYVKELTEWLDVHPLKNDPEAPVWVSLGKNTKNKQISYVQCEHIIANLAKRVGVAKKVNCHILRHAAASDLADKIPEAVAKEHFGWVNDSRMTAVYYHLTPEQIDKALLKAHGYAVSEEEKTEPISTRVCPNCGEVNTILSRFCKKCNIILDISTAWKEKDELVAKILKKLCEDPDIVKKIKEAVVELGLEKEFESD